MIPFKKETLEPGDLVMVIKAKNPDYAGLILRVMKCFDRGDGYPYCTVKPANGKPFHSKFANPLTGDPSRVTCGTLKCFQDQLMRIDGSMLEDNPYIGTQFHKGYDRGGPAATH